MDPITVPGHSAQSVNHYTNRAYVTDDRERVCVEPVSPALATAVARRKLGTENVRFQGFNTLGHAVYSR